MSRFGDLQSLKNRNAEPAAPVAPNPSPAPVAGPEKRPPGRPKGVAKKDNPKFVQVTAYVPAETIAAVKVKLIQDALAEGRKPREFSALVAEQLAAWLKSRPSN